MIEMKKVFTVSFIFALILFGVNKSFGQCTGTLISNFALTSKTDVTCFNANTGQIVVTLNGGQAPFAYSLFIETGGGDIPIASISNTNSQTATFSNLFSNDVEGGTYKVTVVTTNGTSGSPSLAVCQRRTIQNIIINQPTQLVASVSSIVMACVANTGAISLNVSGGTPFPGSVKYVYNWTGPTAIANTVEDPSSLAAGTYSVVIRDENYNAGNPGFCEVTLNNIVVPGQPTISLGSNPMVCTGITNSSISYSATTDSPNQYRIDWVSGIADVTLTALPSTPISITGIPVAPGTYSGALFVSNSTTLCESIGYPISVTVNARPVVSTPSATLCVGSTITASPVAGGTWVSSAPGVATITNAGLITGVSAGSVTFTFTNTTTGCSNTTPSVTVNARPVVSTPSSILCIGTTMTASPSTGGTWISNAPGVATIDNAGLITALTAGSVTFTFTDTATGCRNTTLSVTVNALPVVSTPSDKLCIGATMSATPGTGGTWISTNPAVASIDNAGLITALTAGSVSFTFTETATGCSNTTLSVKVNASPSASISGATAICSGSAATLQIALTGTGPWTFEYSDGATTIAGNSVVSPFDIVVSPSSTTTYTLVSVTDANCVGSIIGLPVLVTVENPPSTGLIVSVAGGPVCSGGSSSIELASSETGVTYQLRNDTDDSLIGTTITGTGSTISFPTGVLTTTTTFNVLATRGTCTPVELTSTATVTVVVGSIDLTLSVSAQQSSICEGSGTNIQILNSETGINYQLRDDSDDSLIGTAIAGTGASINLPTGNLSSSKVFNVLASNAACSIELTTTTAVNVDVNPNPSLSVGATFSPVCIGGVSAVTVDNSEVGVSYQLRDNADNSLVGAAVAGTGGRIEFSTGVLSASKTYNVLATGGVCTPVQLTTPVTVTVAGSINLSLMVTPITSAVCSGTGTDIQIFNSEVGVDYRLMNAADNSFLSGLVAGTGGTLSIPTGALTTATDIRVLVANGSCTAELTTTSTISVSPLPVTSLTVNAVTDTLCSGISTLVHVVNSQPGVTYQLRDDADDSIVSGAVIGNGSTIDLPTGPLASTKTFNVIAINGSCSAELDNKVSVTVNQGPSATISAVAQSDLVCIRTSTFVQVMNSEIGIIYQLRDHLDNSNVSGAAFGSGGTINLPTGPITADRIFNVLASNALCSVQLLTIVTVTVRAITDPLCSNCSTVIVNTINPVKVNCGTTVPDGSITFQIEPSVPVVNIIGVKIQIIGPTPKTQTDDFVFTGLSVGNYTYIVTYGDENNPDCIKTGSFIIELSREPDPITFDLGVDEYDCLVNEGSITLENIVGAPDTDFEFTILSNGTNVNQGVISKTSTVSFTIPDLLLGDYEIQLSQNQQPVNGCVGIVNSQLIDFAIAEPLGGCPVIIPNIFTPNGDGSNDFFEIRNLPVSSSLSITNRWGKEVFSTSDYQNNWSAENISDGVYYYRMVAEGEVMTGWVEILR